MEMMQYKPWEKKETEILISKSSDSLPILDIQLGGACNLKCIYCGSGDTFDMEDLSPHPAEIDYDLSALSYLKRESAPPVICFYGGEWNVF